MDIYEATAWKMIEAMRESMTDDQIRAACLSMRRNVHGSRIFRDVIKKMAEIIETR